MFRIKLNVINDILSTKKQEHIVLYVNYYDKIFSQNIPITTANNFIYRILEMCK